MQVERTDGSFDRPKTYNAEKMMDYLKDDKVESVRVFESTPKNIVAAELRAQLPKDTPRREFRRLLKKFKKTKHSEQLKAQL